MEAEKGPDWSCVMLSVLPRPCECDVGLVEVWSRDKQSRDRIRKRKEKKSACVYSRTGSAKACLQAQVQHAGSLNKQHIQEPHQDSRQGCSLGPQHQQPEDKCGLDVKEGKKERKERDRKLELLPASSDFPPVECVQVSVLVGVDGCISTWDLLACLCQGREKENSHSYGREQRGRPLSRLIVWERPEMLHACAVASYADPIEL
ncbi:unnamed protein product [Leuciscus chuanchicus]